MQMQGGGQQVVQECTLNRKAPEGWGWEIIKGVTC